MQRPGPDRDRQPDAKYSVFQVLPRENRLTESAQAVPLLSCRCRWSFRTRAKQTRALRLLEGHPARIRGSWSENPSPPSRRPAEPALRQGATRQPHDTRVSASPLRMHWPRRSPFRCRRTRFRDNRKSQHRWYFGHARFPGEVPLLQNAADMRLAVPTPSTIQNLSGTSPMLFDKSAGQLTDCRSILPPCPAEANRLQIDASLPVSCTKSAGQL